MEPNQATAAPDQRRRRLTLRATHMGTKENDVLLGGYVAAHIAQLTEAELDSLEDILTIPDPVLADWLTGRAAIPDDVTNPLLRKIRASIEKGVLF